MQRDYGALALVAAAAPLGDDVGGERRQQRHRRRQRHRLFRDQRLRLHRDAALHIHLARPHRLSRCVIRAGFIDSSDREINIVHACLLGI